MHAAAFILEFTNLKYAGKSGRIPSAAAFIGDKIGIKPIMKIWDHEITTAGKCRGEKKVVSKICDMAIADMEPGSEYQIEYGNDEKIKEEMAAKMTEKLGCDGFNLVQNNHEVAGQTVFHFHMHLIPRYLNAKNNDILNWSHETFSPEEMAEIRDSLKMES